MAVREILKIGDPRLRKKAKKVTSFGSKFNGIVNDMVDTLTESGGIGLAAPQIGVDQQIMLIAFSNKLHLYVNPKVLFMSKEETIDIEGCLSVPGLDVPISRPSTVTFKALTWKNEPAKMYTMGEFARIFLHELDHLKGILTVDYAYEDMEDLQIKEILDKMEEKEEVLQNT